MISPDYKHYIQNVDKSQDDFIKLTLTGNHELFCLYIPPIDSIYFKDETFSLLADSFVAKEDNQIIFGGGDLNCRIGNDMRQPPPGGKYRENPDKVVNSHGRFLVDLCKTFNCYPLNNLTFNRKSFDGKYTFYNGNRKSQSDVVVGNPDALPNIECFTIHELSFNPSDHFPVVASCNFPLCDRDVKSISASDLLTTASEPCIKRIPKINP